MIIFTDIKSAILPLEQVVLEGIKKYSPQAVFFRDKNLQDEEYIELANKIIPICKQNNVQFYVCHKADVAKKLGVKNLHTNIKNLSKIVIKNDFDNISVAIHSKEEIDTALSFGATGLVFGHIFDTACKKDLPPRGLEELKEICRSSPIPVVAIGGINSENAKQVMDCGASDFAVMSSAMTLTF